MITATDSHTWFAALYAALYALAALRLLCYHRPKGARYRPALSLSASLLIAACFCRALALFAAISPAHGLDALTSVLLCGTAFAARGNLAFFWPRSPCSKS